MFKFLGCTPETITDWDMRILEEYEDAGLYPPRFNLHFENKSHQTKSSCHAKIILTGFVSHSNSLSPNILINTILGEKYGETLVQFISVI